MQMKNRSEDGWQPMYPKTLADNVTLSSGETVQEKVEEIKGMFPERNPLWSGEIYPNESETAKPNKPLSECVNGWTLVWKRTGRNQQIQHTDIHKHSLDYANGFGHRATLGDRSGTLVMKYFYINDTEITGHATNESGDNGGLSLIRIYEF